MVENLQQLEYEVTNEQGTSFEWVKNPVSPLTDEMIARLPVRERADKVKDIALGRFGTSVIEMARKMEEEHLQPESLLLACLLKDRDFRANEEMFLSNRLIAATGEHQTILRSMRNKERGGKLKQAEKGENERWQLTKDGLVTKIEAQRGIKQALADVVLMEYFLKPGGLDNLGVAVEDLRDLGILDKSSLNGLMEDVQQRIENILPVELSNFSYKLGVENIRSEEQAKVLTELVIQSTVHGPADEWQQQMRMTARGLLLKYERYPVALYGREEKTPLVALTHDLLYAAAMTRDSRLFRVVGGRVVNLVQKQRKMFNEETRVMMELVLKDMDKRLAVIEEKKKTLGLKSLSDEQLVRQFSPLNEEHPNWVGRYYDRSVSMDTAFAVLTEELGLEQNPYEVVRRQNSKLVVSKIKQLSFNLDDFNEKEAKLLVWRSLVGNYFTEPVSLDVLLSANYLTKAQYTQRKTDLYRDYSQVSFDDVEHRKMMINELENDTELPTVVKQTLMVDARLVQLMLTQPDMSMDQLREMQGSNQERLRQVFHKNFGGVAGGGDWYRANRDADLGSMQIDAMGLLPMSLQERAEVFGSMEEARVRQAFAVTLITDGGKVELRLRDDGEIFLRGGKRLRIPVWIREPLMKVVLDRLAFSTRKVGDLGSSGESRKSFDELVKPSETFRWRPLPNPPYHLRSDTAQRHAAKVLADPRYGFDTYATILLWRSKGIIGHNEVVTYVRPSDEAANNPREMTFRAEELISL
jgi:hypothetical protein